MKTPFFSIILGTFNRLEYLKEAIQSVLNQKFSDWQLVVVDDFSSDGTEEYLKTLTDGRIKVIRNESTQGNYHSKAIGYEYCNGIYITFLDDDDELPDDALENRYNEIERRKSPDILHSNILFKYFDNNRWNLRPWFANYNLTYRDVWYNKQSEDYCQIVCNTMTIRRDVIENCGLWNYREFPYNGADIEYCLRIIKRGYKFELCDTPTYIYRQHKEQITVKTYSNDGLNILNRIKDLHKLEDFNDLPRTIEKPDIEKVKKVVEDIIRQRKDYLDENKKGLNLEYIDKKVGGLTILNIHPKYDCAAAGILLTDVLNEFTEHKVYHIFGEPTFLEHEAMFIIGKDDKKIKELVEKADILHFNKYLWSENKNLHWIAPYIKDKTCILHLHGNIDIWRPKEQDNIIEIAQRHGMNIVSCSPITETLIKNVTWLPNPIPTHKPEYMPIYRNFNTPLRLIHTVIAKYNKGTDDLLYVLEYLKHEFLNNLDYKIVDREKTIKQTLDEKKSYHACVDNITQGFIGMAGWEAMSLGLSCIARLDPYVKKRYEEMFPEGELPIIDVNGIDQMAIEIVKLNNDIEYRYNKAIESRLWMETNYNPERLAKIWSDYYKSIVEKNKDKK